MFSKKPVMNSPRYKIQPEKVVVIYSLSRVQLFGTPWTVARQALLSSRFSRQESWSGLPFPPPWDLPDPGIEPTFHLLQAGSLPLRPQESPAKLNQVKPVQSDGTTTSLIVSLNRILLEACGNCELA